MNETTSASSKGRGAWLSALKNKENTKKEGSHIVLSVLSALGLFLLSQFASLFGFAGYIVYHIMKNRDVTQSFHFEIGKNMFNQDVILIMLFSDAVMILLFVLYAKYVEKRPIRTLGFTTKNMLLSYPAGILGAALSMFAAALFSVLTGAMTFSKGSLSLPYLLLFTMGWIIQGLAEEVMCRGFLMTSIAKRYSLTTAILVNSILFAILHVFNPSGLSVFALINLFLYAVLASLMFLYTKNIWLCAAFHTAWNMIQGNILGIPVSGIRVPSFFVIDANEHMPLLNGGPFGLEGSLPVTAVLLIGCILLFLLLRRKSAGGPK